MSTFVIVHGAWTGGWSWARVRSRLRAAGHEVFTPTLTGLGERVHLARPEVDLTTHITDVVNTIWFEDLHDVILAGHSYGGMVITGVAERIPERLSQLVYVDAFVPQDGQAMLDLIPADRRLENDERVRIEGEGWRLESISRRPVEEHYRDVYHVTDPDDLRWLLRYHTPQPYRTMTEPVRCPSHAAEKLARTYIWCEGQPSTFEQFARVLRQPESGWSFASLPTWHMANVTMPNELAAVLGELA